MTPLTTMQRSYWMGELFAGDDGARATVSFGLDIAPPVDVDRLDRALTAVVRRHPLLRGRVMVGDGGVPSLAIGPVPATILTRLDSEAELDAWFARPVSVRDAVPCRAAVAAGADVVRVRVLAHHVFFDGGSKDVFLRDLARAYADASWPGEGALDDLPFWRTQVARERAANDGAEAAPSWHGAQVDSRPPACESLLFGLEPALQDLADDAAARVGVSRFALQLAAWHAAIARLQPGDDVETSIALTTRVDADFDEIGPFVNQRPVRSSSPRTRSLASLATELAEELRRIAVERYRHDALPDRPAGPEIAISYRRTTIPGYAWPGATATPLVLMAGHAAPTDVLMRLIRDGRVTHAVIDVDANVLPAGYAHDLTRSWRALLRAGSQRLDARVGELPLAEAA